MKQICMKSGVEITTTHSLVQVAAKAGVKRTLVGTHPAFSYSFRELASILAATEADSLTPAQRHVLIVAALEALGTLEQHYPILPDTCGLNDLTSLQLFPTLVRAYTTVALNATEWARRRASESIPRLAVRKELIEEISIPEFILRVLAPEVAFLSASRAHNFRTSEIRDELEFERELMAVLWKRKESTYIRYTPNVGKAVMKFLKQELELSGRGSEIPVPIWTAFQEVIVKTPVQVPHIPDTVVFRLEDYIANLSISCDPDDTILRSYIALTTSHLRSIREHRDNLDTLFGIITERPVMPVNPALGEGSFTITTPAPSPLAMATPVSANPIAELKPKAGTKLAARILAARAALRQGAPRGGRTEEENSK